MNDRKAGGYKGNSYKGNAQKENAQKGRAQKSGERRLDKGRTEERKFDEKRAGERTSGGRRVDEGRADSRRTGGRRLDDGRTVEKKSDGKGGNYRDSSGKKEYSGYRDGKENSGKRYQGSFGDQKGQGKFKEEKYRGDKFKEEKYRGDKFKEDKYKGDKFKEEKYRGGKFKEEKYRGDKFKEEKYKGDKFRGDKFKEDKAGEQKKERWDSKSEKYKGDKPRDEKYKGQGYKKEDSKEKYSYQGENDKDRKYNAGPKYQKYSEKAPNNTKAGEKKGKYCSVMGKCGGCQFLTIPYEEQLKKKEQKLKDACGSFVKFPPMIGMEHPEHYRNKVHAVFGEDRKHNPISGNYEEKSHIIVPVDSCILENQKADEIIVSIRGLLKSFKIRPYNEDSGYGLLRHVLVRTGYASGEIMVVLVLVSPILPSKNNFVKALLKIHPEITTIVLNVNDRDTSMVLGDKEQVIYGKGYIEDTLCGKVFRISPKSFYQVNPVQTEKLYGKAMEFAGLSGKETVLDAYCGTGTIGMIASDRAAKVIGVELNEDAVRDARANAKQNHISNIDFYRKDAGEFMVELAEQNVKVDVVFMDPPRAGSDEVFLSSLVKLRPEKVVYISCNPETLARDLKYLTGKGYRVEKGVGVDMFPWTWHVESVIKMQYCGVEKKK